MWIIKVGGLEQGCGLVFWVMLGASEETIKTFS
jgi:hypothetical protein